MLDPTAPRRTVVRAVAMAPLRSLERCALEASLSCAGEADRVGLSCAKFTHARLTLGRFDEWFVATCSFVDPACFATAVPMQHDANDAFKESRSTHRVIRTSSCVCHRTRAIWEDWATAIDIGGWQDYSPAQHYVTPCN